MVLALSSCAQKQVGPVVMDNKPIHVSMKYQKHAYGINMPEITSESIQKAMLQKTQYRFSTKCSVVNSFDKTKCVYYLNKGLIISKNKQGLTFNYVKGLTGEHERRIPRNISGSQVSFPIDLKVTSDKKYYYVDLVAKQGVYHPSPNLFGGITEPLARLDEIKADVSRIIHETYNENYTDRVLIKGSLNSKWKPDDVRSNLLRLISHWRSNDLNSRTTLIDTGNFAYTYKGQDLHLYISVFPYHGHSKVDYYMYMPLTFLPDGTITLDKKREATKLKSFITKVVND